MHLSITPAARFTQAADRKRALHIEVARHYAWKARQRRQRYGPGDKPRLITLIRLRELERLYVSRWGHVLPADDSGREDFEIAAHHIAHLGGDVRGHIIAYAGMWAPWMSPDEAAAIAAEVMARPVKWTADSLGWRLRLTDAERTALRITTIGAFDVGKAERLERRKAKRRAADRAKWAKRRSGRPRGRPKIKSPASSTDSIAGRRISAALRAKLIAAIRPWQRLASDHRSGPAHLARSGYHRAALAAWLCQMADAHGAHPESLPHYGPARP